MILCIDDEPRRYVRLAHHLRDGRYDQSVVVTCRAEEVKFYFRTATVIGVCLDFDMPFGSGESFARQFLTERNTPVVISSHNPSGAMRIMDLLTEFDTPNLYRPVKDHDSWVLDVVKFFKLDPENLR